MATIELLSPINKIVGSQGRRDFARKREQVIASTAHWIEIDLLRGGTRPVDLPRRAAYYAGLHRAGPPATLAVWLATLRQELPTIAVPLLAPAADAVLDLREAVETLYER